MNYDVVYSDRKTVGISVKSDGTLIVKAPVGTKRKDIDKILEENSDRVERLRKRFGHHNKMMNKASVQEEILLRRKASEIIPGKVEYYSKKLGVSVSNVKITSARKRVGSCSKDGRICFSFYLMRFPDEVIDYVVVHELCHIIHFNHSKEFYAQVEQILPDYRERQKKLKGDD